MRVEWENRFLCSKNYCRFDFLTVFPIPFISVLWRVLSRIWLWGIWKLLHTAASSRVSCVYLCVYVPVSLIQNAIEISILVHRDTEYYDYGHGEAQETTYESYSKYLSMFLCFPSTTCWLTAPLVSLSPISAAQDEWDNSWSSAGAGGKAAPARQAKGAYREHPYGRYWSPAGRALPRQLYQIVTLWTFQK